MSEQPRPIPDHPSLRYLKLEAKRRLAAGEFTALYEAQLAIAREHGQPSWAALKQLISAAEPDGPALEQVRWVQNRFRGAGSPEWSSPTEDELREHFAARFLSVLSPATVIRTLSGVAQDLSRPLVPLEQGPTRLRAQIAHLRVEAAVDPESPHPLTGLRLYPVGRSVTDARVADPGTRRSGDVPSRAARVAEEAFTEHGLVGLVLAGAGADEPSWSVARGWANLERGETLRPEHGFPAYAVTKLITSTAVLRLVADGRAALDGPAGRFLRTARLADETITVRELLSHTGGVDSPPDMFVDGPAELPELFDGPVVPCSGPRGQFSYRNGGYAVLGRLIADLTGLPYAEAAARLVLEPLGMTRSGFPSEPPTAGVTHGYRLTETGEFVPDPARIFRIPAAGGLWTTAGDLIRFSGGWRTLLPAGLAGEAVRAHAVIAEGGTYAGLGWLVNPAKEVYGHAGSGPGSATSLLLRADSGRTSVAHTNRLLPIEPINARLIRPID